MTRTQRAERVKRWSTYQGGSWGPPLSVPLGYRESHTVGRVGGQLCPERWPKEVGSITSRQDQGAPCPQDFQEDPGGDGSPRGTTFPSLLRAAGLKQAPNTVRGNYSRFSSWSPTTLRRATEIMKRLRRKQTSQSFPTAAPHTARTTPW